MKLPSMIGFSAKLFLLVSSITVVNSCKHQGSTENAKLPVQPTEGTNKSPGSILYLADNVSSQPGEPKKLAIITQPSFVLLASLGISFDDVVEALKEANFIDQSVFSELEDDEPPILVKLNINSSSEEETLLAKLGNIEIKNESLSSNSGGLGLFGSDWLQNLFFKTKVDDTVGNTEKAVEETKDEPAPALAPPKKIQDSSINKFFERDKGILKFLGVKIDSFVWDEKNGWFKYDNPTSKKMTVMLLPTYDHNQAFYDQLFKTLDVTKDSSVILSDIGSVAELKSLLQRLPDQKADVFWLSGHGTPNSQQLGFPLAYFLGIAPTLTTKEFEEDQDLKELFNKKIRDDGLFVAWGCSISQFIEGANYAEALARMLGSRKVIAPSLIGYGSDLHMVSGSIQDIKFKRNKETSDLDKTKGENYPPGYDYTVVLNPSRGLRYPEIYPPSPVPNLRASPPESGKPFQIKGYDLSDDNRKYFDAMFKNLSQQSDFQFGAVQLERFRDSDANTLLSALSSEAIPWLRLEGLVQTSNSKQLFQTALRVTKTKLVCNCDFDTESFSRGSLSLKHLDVRRLVIDSGTSLFSWEAFPSLRRLGINRAALLHLNTNDTVQSVVVHNDDTGSLAADSGSYVEACLNRFKNASKVTFELGPTESDIDFQTLLDRIPQGDKKWSIERNDGKRLVLVSTP